ncbi:MAG: gamma-glutamyltransferase [Deltaproteobacteria bacterium]|nr:gamma-glutamyltransferase [Deltaproteobacteria bacterium]
MAVDGRALRWAAAALALLAAGCGGWRSTAQDNLPEPRQARIAVGHSYVPAAPRGHFAVATAHPAATHAAVAALRKGGSAVDAVVAASLVLSVATPQSTGIGGGGFAVVAPPGAAARAFDFRETAPAATQVADYLDGSGRLVAERSQHHGLAVGVPGYVAGLWTLHQRWGRRPWAEVCEPAAALAEAGVEVTPQLAGAIEVMWPALDGAARLVFGRNGIPLHAGELLRWPGKASTLRAIARQGPGAFYAGPVAQDIARAVQDAGGKLTETDLQRYAVRELEPLRGEVFGHLALTMPPPSAGGAQLLAMAEWFGPWQAKAGGTYAQDPALAHHALAEAMRRSFVLRLAYSSDSEAPPATLDAIYPAAARAALRDGFDPTRAGKSADLRAATTGKRLESHDNTSHVSVVDGDGLAVASTHTVNLLLGSGIVAPHSGVLLNNEMDDFSYSDRDSNAFGLAASLGNRPTPGARPVSSMTPTILMRGPTSNPQGPWLVIGSPGGPRIATAVTQVIFRVAYTGWSLADAVGGARVHHQAFPDEAWIETGPQGDAMARQLQAFGHAVARKSAWCNVQAVLLQHGADGTHQWLAVSDPRGEGLAAAR